MKTNHVNTHPFSREGVLARMTERAGREYECIQLARQFRVRSTDMAIVLKKLAADGKIQRVSRPGQVLYYVPAMSPMSSAVTESRHPVREFRPLVGYETQMRSIAAAAEQGRR